MIFGDFQTTNLEKQSKNWKLQGTGRKGRAMFVLTFYISERFRIRLWRIVLLTVVYCATRRPNYAPFCQNSQIMLLISEIMLTK